MHARADAHTLMDAMKDFLICISWIHDTINIKVNAHMKHARSAGFQLLPNLMKYADTIDANCRVTIRTCAVDQRRKAFQEACNRKEQAPSSNLGGGSVILDRNNHGNPGPVGICPTLLHCAWGGPSGPNETDRQRDGGRRRGGSMQCCHLPAISLAWPCPNFSLKLHFGSFSVLLLLGAGR